MQCPVLKGSREKSQTKEVTGRGKGRENQRRISRKLVLFRPKKSYERKKRRSQGNCGLIKLRDKSRARKEGKDARRPLPIHLRDKRNSRKKVDKIVRASKLKCYGENQVMPLQRKKKVKDRKRK